MRDWIVFTFTARLPKFQEKYCSDGAKVKIYLRFYSVFVLYRYVTMPGIHWERFIVYTLYKNYGNMTIRHVHIGRGFLCFMHTF